MYTALDEIYARPILEQFEREHGVRVRAQYDVESQKTVGLVNRLVQERANPRCDVFWNNELVHSVRLAAMGLLEPFDPESARDLPERWRDAQKRWNGFAARVRVVCHDPGKHAASALPRCLEEFAEPRFRGLAMGIASPLFGTTSTHFAVLLDERGEARFVAFLKALRTNGVRVLDGNARVMRAVAEGRLDVGLTDSDDVSLGVRSLGFSLEAHPDTGAGRGALLIPNTLAIVRGAPHEAHARALVNYLLRRDVEQQLATSPSAQIPLRAQVERPEGMFDPGRSDVRVIAPERVAEQVERCAELVREVLLDA